MSYTPKYIVSAGSLVIEDCDQAGNCIGRTLYTPERFAAERETLPSSVVAAYESGSKGSKANKAKPSPDDVLIASNQEAPTEGKGYSAYAERSKAVAKKASAKTSTKATAKAAKKATTKR